MGGEEPVTVVAVKAVGSGMPKDLWHHAMPLPGDIILQIGDNGVAPFFGGKAALQDELRRLYRTNCVIPLKVQRLRNIVDLTACVVAEECCISKKRFTLRASSDARHVVILDDSTEDACAKLQKSTEEALNASANQRKAAKATSRVGKCLQDGGFSDSIISYPWETKMEESLPASGSSMIFSILFAPPSEQDSHDFSDFRTVEYTVARAMAWFCAVQYSGVPVVFVNIQTELMLHPPNSVADSFDGCDADPTKKGTILRLVESGRHAVDCCSGPKIEVTRGVRLWYAPVSAELAFDLKLKPGDVKFGLSICRTEEGFCCVTAVEKGSAGDRAGLKTACECAKNRGKLMVISRVAGKKVTPWMVSPDGSIHCYDTRVIEEMLQLAECIPSLQIHTILCGVPNPQSLDIAPGIAI